MDAHTKHFSLKGNAEMVRAMLAQSLRGHARLVARVSRPRGGETARSQAAMAAVSLPTAEWCWV